MSGDTLSDWSREFLTHRLTAEVTGRPFTGRALGRISRILREMSRGGYGLTPELTGELAGLLEQVREMDGLERERDSLLRLPTRLRVVVGGEDQ